MPRKAKPPSRSKHKVKPPSQAKPKKARSTTAKAKQPSRAKAPNRSTGRARQPGKRKPPSQAKQATETLPPNGGLLTEAEAARLLGHSARTLQKWRLEGNGPPFLRMGKRSVRYRRTELENWLVTRVRHSTSQG